MAPKNKDNLPLDRESDLLGADMAPPPGTLPPYYFPGGPFIPQPIGSPAGVDLANHGVDLALDGAIENREQGGPTIRGRGGR